jgi:diguanylate cyclase
VMVDWGLNHTVPLVQLPHSTMMVLRYFNLSFFLMATSLTAISHAECVNGAENRLRTAADTDSLSGLMNRRRMTDQLQLELERAADRHRPLSVLLLDIDHFKVINDEHGHVRGDYVIARVGELLRETVRQSDIAARWGGEEFMVLLPDTRVGTATETAERIRRAIFTNVVRSTSDLMPVSVTIGVASWRVGESLESTIHRADLAMYAGKRSGRNQVVLESDESSTLGRRAVG